MNYLRFIRVSKNKVAIENIDGEALGYLERTRVGAWMSWCLFLNRRHYMSASCLDEAREMIRKLNADKKMKNNG